ncbi:MAG TPA: class I SAM-dependent methyltransferase [Ferruginibacter sp.]|nr:class I SAM-dependent methyltransferase [Ferruginibacter sp.]
MIHYPGCPVCKSGNIHPFFTAKDHTVSGSLFGIWKCDDCTAMFTQDVPSIENIGSYYQSEKYISHSDTQQGFINRLYHIVRKYTLFAKRKMIGKETGLEMGNILDIGSGTGGFLDTMQQVGWKATGLEPGEDAREKAKSLYGVHVLPSQELFNLPPASFDVITMWHVLEHVHQLQNYIEQIKKLITSKGLLFIAVPNYTSYDAAHYKQDWAGYDVPRHLYHFSPRSMKKLMDMHGLKIIKIKPMWFDSYYVSMLSEQYRNGGMLKAFFMGLLSSLNTMGNRERCSSLVYIIKNVEMSGK